MFSFSRPDSLIAEYNIRNVNETEETDLYYLMYLLSEDAAPQIAQIAPEQLEESGVKDAVEQYFRNISTENEETSLRAWNYSRAEAAKAAEEWLSEK